MILVLEDQPHRQKWFRENLVGCIIAYSAQEAIERLQDNEYDSVYLDHDLSEDHMFLWTNRTTEEDYYHAIDSYQNTGYEVARFLEQNPSCNSKAKIFLHSINFSGRKRMKQALRNRPVYDCPFYMLCQN